MDINRAKTEAAALEAAIAESQAKLSAMRSWIEQGERLFGAPASPPAESLLATASVSIVPMITPSQAKSAAVNLRAPGKKERVTTVVFEALKGGGRMRAKELADLVKADGIDLGHDPVQALSVYVSRDGRFDSARALGGWGLKSSPNKEKAPQGVSAPAGPDLLDFQSAVGSATGPTPD